MCLHDGPGVSPGQETRFGHQAPPTDRGAEITPNGPGPLDELKKAPITVGVHWVQGVFPLVLQPGDIVELVAKHLGEEPSAFVEVDHGWNTYLRSWHGPHGILIAYHRAKGGVGGGEAAPREAFVSLPGTACEVMGTEKIREWCKVLPKATRIDFAMDVPKDCAPAPEAVRDLWKQDRGAFRTAAKKGKYCEEDGENPGDPCPATTYIGTRSSGRFLRVYSRREGVMRFEVEMKAEAAEDARDLVAGWGDFCGIVVGKIRDFCDFVVPASNVTRAELAPWWSLIVENFQRIRFARARVVETIERKIEWIQTAVAATFIACLEATGGDLGRLLPEDTRRSPRLQRLVDGFKHQAALQPVPS